MTGESIRVSTVLPVSRQRIYAAWMDSGEHSAFTGGKAEVEPVVGGKYTAWDGYILGTTTELEPYRRIVQTWRTTDFPPGSPDSRLELLLDELPQGTRLTLVHTGLSPGGGQEYKQGWKDYYFKPMKKYFAAK